MGPLRWTPWVLGLALLACDDGSSREDLPPVSDLGFPSSVDAAGGSDSMAGGGGGGIAPGFDVALPMGGRDAGAASDDAMAPSGGADGDAAVVDGGTVAWSDRPCTVTLRYTGAGQEVLVAGEFTGWADSPRPMTRNGAAFELTLGPDDGLRGGELYAYKFVVDGSWQMNPVATHHRYVDRCVNSAFLVPACESAPALVAEPVETTWDSGAQLGGVRATVRAERAVGGALPERFEAWLDGMELDGDAVTLDAGTGRFEIAVDGLAPGKHRLSLRLWDADDVEAAPVDLPFWIEAVPFDWRGALLYMLVVDRFANGDEISDDRIGDPVQYAADWHGGDLWGATEVMESGYFESIGVRAIWLSPINRQVDGHFDGRNDDRQYSAYHGYWPIEGQEVDPRYGGDEALRAFIDAAHARGIRVLFDLINNQIHEQHSYYASNPEWFRTACVCGVDAGCGWSERPLDCLFAPYLPDINWREPGAQAQFIADAIYWIEAFDVDGFRVDAVKHVETLAVFNLRHALTRRFEQGGERIVMLGETAVGEGDRFEDGCGIVYDDGYQWIEAYTGATALDGQFDFPSHHRMQWGLLTGTMGFDDIDDVVRDMQTRYSSDALHVRFLGSHDSNRMVTRAAQDGARDCRWPGAAPCESLPEVSSDPDVFARLKRAFTVLFTLPGIPLLYYGDEVAMAGGNDPDSRRDMPWDAALRDVSMADVEPTAAQTDVRAWIRAIAAARAAHPVVALGRYEPLVAEPDLWVYARVGAAPGSLAVMVVNRGAAVDGRVALLPAGLDAAGFERVAGEGNLEVDGTSLTVSIGAGGSAIFVAQQP